MHKILLTRADNEIEGTGKLFSDAGFEVISCPIFRVIFLLPERFSSNLYQAILITSRNGVRACAQMELDRATPLMVVGESTAELARQLGFKQVKSGGGCVASLIDTIQKNYHPQRGRLLYGRGKIIRQDLKGSLEIYGFTVDERILYRLDGISSLPPQVVTCLKRRELWGALFFSENTAGHFRTLIHAEGLGKALEFVYLFGLSSVILRTLEGEGRALLMPSVPELRALVQLLQKTRSGGENGQKEGNTGER